MKKFYLILIGFIFLGFISETDARQQQQQHKGQSAKAQRHGKAPASKIQKGKNGKRVVAKGKARQKSTGAKGAAKGNAKGANTCTTKEIVTVVKGAKLLANGKGTPALKAAYKKMLGCYSKIKGKKAIPKPLQSFAKGLKSACAKRAKNKDLAKVFKNTCGNSKVSAGAKGAAKGTAKGANTCTTKEIVTVVKGAKLLANGKGTPALKAAYKKMLGCYSKIKGKKAIPKPLQSFAKGLKSACAKRKTPEMKKVFARTCGAVKAPLKKQKALSPVANDDDSVQDDATAQVDDDSAVQDDTTSQADDDSAGQDDASDTGADDLSMSDSSGNAGMDDDLAQDADDPSISGDVSMDDGSADGMGDDTSIQDADADGLSMGDGSGNVGMGDSFSNAGTGLGNDMSGGNTGFDNGGFDSIGDFSGNSMSSSYDGFNSSNGYDNNGWYSGPPMGYPPLQGGGYPYGGGYPNMGGGYPNMNGGFGGSNLGF
jgi:hypothetical protein